MASNELEVSLNGMLGTPSFFMESEYINNSLVFGSKVNFTKAKILSLLGNNKDIDNKYLRFNLIYFLSQVAPIATEFDVKLAIHPDDPPFSVLGLPRMVSTEKDLKTIFNAVPENANGLCYCTDSLGANPNNDLEQIIDKHGNHIHFLHIRNIKRDSKAIFRESEHVNGDNPIESIMGKLIL